MGEITDAVLEGEFCQVCGEYLGEAVGYQRSCGGCQGEGAQPHMVHEGHSERKATRRANGLEKLRTFTNSFTQYNNGWHIVVDLNGVRFDFYPSTGKWREGDKNTRFNHDTERFWNRLANLTGKRK